MGNLDIKRARTVLFIIVIIWLITITTVFQIRINDIPGNVDITLIQFMYYQRHIVWCLPFCNLFITENVKSLTNDFDDALQNLRKDMKEMNEELAKLKGKLKLSDDLIPMRL